MTEQPTEQTPGPEAGHGMLSGRAATERAEQLLEQWGQQARVLIAVFRQQLGSTITGAHTTGTQGNGQERASVAQPGAPAPELSAEGTRPPAQPAPERAEAVLDEWGNKIGRSASLAGQQLRRMAARAREEAEDILAEAQHLRHSDGGKSNPA
jgi:hypothetical protein